MLFCVNTFIRKFHAPGFALLLAASLALAGCGGGSGTTTTDPGTTDPGTMDPGTMDPGTPDPPEPTPQETCENAGGRWNADMTCTSAEDLAAEEAARVMAATAAAATMRTAIAAEAAQETDAGLGGTGVTTYSIDVSYADGIEISDSALAGAGDPKFVDQMAGLDDGRSMLVRTMEADEDGNVVEEVVFVGTDIEAFMQTPFLVAIPIDSTNGVNIDLTNDSPALTYEALEITTGSNNNQGNLVAPALASSAPGTLNFSGGSTVDGVPAFSTPATYRGGSGDLTCNAGSGNQCTATFAADGSSVLSSNWVFVPHPDATIDVEDSDFLHYGVWLKRTRDSDGAVTYNEVETFAGSSVTATPNVSSVTGTAEYAGDAVGVYVREVYKTTDASVDTATSGHFKADVSLTATFGQVNDENGEGTIPPNLLNTLRGSISNFVLQHGEENDWAVDLHGDISADGIVSNNTGADGGGAPAPWNASFYGPNEDAESNPIHPHSVVGEFNANFGNGVAAGAFGARLQ